MAGDLQLSRSSARGAADLLISARAMLSCAQAINLFLPAAATVHGTRLDASVLPRAGWPEHQSNACYRKNSVSVAD